MIITNNQLLLKELKTNNEKRKMLNSEISDEQKNQSERQMEKYDETRFTKR